MKIARFAFPAMVLAAVLVVGPLAGAATTIDLAAVRKDTAPAVCRVTVENAWGVPLALASGFLLGDGRFAVTDLGAATHPGVDRVSLHFQDGATIVVREFGMAEPALSLVLLRLPADAPKRQGLALAQGLPALEGNATVVVAGWQWSRQFEVVTGRLYKGPLIKEVAALTRVDMPSGVDAFVRVDGGRLEGAAGAPVLDAEGTVLAVNLDVPIRNTIATLAMPATSLRTALMAAVPQLRPLSQLPKPLWPTRPLRTPGGPVTSQAFLGVISQFKTAVACQRCGGRGRIATPYGGMGGGMGYGYGYGDYTMPCPTCGGETVVFNEAALKLLGTVAEQGTSTVWAPVVDERVRTKVRSGAQDTLVTLAGYGNHFQRELASAAASALESRGLVFPAGMAFKARVSRLQDGPDGRYLFITPQHTNATVAVRVDDLVPPPGKGLPPRKEPAEGSWILVAGTILGRCAADGRPSLFLLPLEWMTVPAPAGAPAFDMPRPRRPGP
jgi:ribosomal protein S27E